MRRSGENKTARQHRLDQAVRALSLVGRAPALPMRVVASRPANNYLKLSGGPGFALEETFPFDDTSEVSTRTALAAATSAYERAKRMAIARGKDTSAADIRLVAYRDVPGFGIVGRVGEGLIASAGRSS